LIFETKFKPESQTIFINILNLLLKIFCYHLPFFPPLPLFIHFYFYCLLLELFRLLSYLKEHHLLHFLFHPFSSFFLFSFSICLFYLSFFSCFPCHHLSFFSFFMILIFHFYFLGVYLLNLHFICFLLYCYQERSQHPCFYYFLPIDHLLLLPFKSFNFYF
jgi:hypothetical protein